MTGSDVFCMPMETTIMNPVSVDGNSLPITITSFAYSESLGFNDHNKIMTGFPVHSMLQDETINHFQASMHIPNYSKVSDSDTVRDLQLGKDIIGDFASGTSHPISNTFQDRLTERMPLPAASLATLLAYKYGPHENLEKFATSAPALAYPLEFAKNIVMNDYSDTINHSTGNSLNCGYEGVPIDSSTRWDFNRIIEPPQRRGTITGRTVLQPFQLVGNITTNGCISSENVRMSSYSPSGSSRYSNELSLSLAMSQPSVVCGTSIQDQCSDISCSGISNHSLYEPHVGQEQTSCSNSSKPGQLSQFLSGSRYLHVMQEILADFAHYSSENLNLMTYPAIGTVNNASTCIHSSDADAGCSSTLGYIDRSLDQIEPTLQGWDFERKRKKHLLTLLQEVDSQFNQWLDEIHTVISAFHAVTELDPQIHARFALQTISVLYKDLRERISSHILTMGACFSKVGATEEEKSFEMSFIQKQWALQQLRRKDQQLWRPQRGLPERSVSVLRAWMFQNFLHPYPKDAEKHLLAVKSGLTRSQVSNWFINARVRLWKPMIEEMYAEMNRRKNRRN